MKRTPLHLEAWDQNKIDRIRGIVYKAVRPTYREAHFEDCFAYVCLKLVEQKGGCVRWLVADYFREVMGPTNRKKNEKFKFLKVMREVRELRSWHVKDCRPDRWHEISDALNSTTHHRAVKALQLSYEGYSLKEIGKIMGVHGLTTLVWIREMRKELNEQVYSWGYDRPRKSSA